MAVTGVALNEGTPDAFCTEEDNSLLFDKERLVDCSRKGRNCFGFVAFKIILFCKRDKS